MVVLLQLENFDIEAYSYDYFAPFSWNYWSSNQHSILPSACMLSRPNMGEEKKREKEC